jgi:hypothetical protein
MVIQFEPLEGRLLRADGVRRNSYVNRLRRVYLAWDAGLVPLDTLCTEAGEALHEYASETLDAFIRAAKIVDESDRSGWLVHAYRDGISRTAVALRDAVSDLSARHAVAQRLQERLLQAESRLRFLKISRSGTAVRARS